jgi:ActR/RegA family two-component response regulator
MEKLLRACNHGRGAFTVEFLFRTRGDRMKRGFSSSTTSGRSGTLSEAFGKPGTRVPRRGRRGFAILREKMSRSPYATSKCRGWMAKVLRHIRDVSPETVVILITAYASVETAVNALRNGRSIIF